MIGFYVPDTSTAEKLIEYFKQKGSTSAWIDENPGNIENKINMFNDPKYKSKNMKNWIGNNLVEVLIPEDELRRLNYKIYSEVTKEFTDLDYQISWPSCYGDPNFSFK